MSQPPTILEIPRKLLILSILLASVFIAGFIAVEVSSVSRAPIQRYNNALVQLYIKTENPQTISYVEETVNTTELSNQAFELFRVQFWKNYMSAPENYWSVPSYGESSPLAPLFRDRNEEFLSFILNRQDYLADQSRWFMLDMTNHDIIPIDDIINELNLEVDLLNKAVASNNTDDIHRHILQIEAISTSYGEASRAENTNELFMFSPRYELFVYDSFRRAPFSLLQEQAKEILLDKREDPVLRLLAARYLAYDSEGNYVNPESTEFLLQLIESLVQSGGFVDEQLYEREVEIAFQQGIFTIVGVSVSDFVENAPAPTPTPRS